MTTNTISFPKYIEINTYNNIEILIYRSKISEDLAIYTGGDGTYYEVIRQANGDFRIIE